MNYRQIITAIIANLNQTERNMDGLNARDKQQDIDQLTHKLFAIRYLSSAMADESYAAIKKYLKGGELNVEKPSKKV